MAGNRFGGQASTYLVMDGGPGSSYKRPSATADLTFWSGTPLDVGRVMYDDLRTLDAPDTPVNTIQSLPNGDLPEFIQPDESVVAMWASADGGNTGTWITTHSPQRGEAPTWAALPDKPTIPTTAADVGALPADTPIPATAADIGALAVADTDAQVAALAQNPQSETGAALSATYASKDDPRFNQIGGGASQRVTQILADTRAAASSVALVRSSATLYYLWQALRDGLWLRMALQRGDTFLTPAPGSSLVHQLADTHLVYPMVSVEEDAASVTATGTGWTVGTNAASYGGDYLRSNVTGDARTFTTPADTVAVGLHHITVSNGGVSKVTIDGDPTVANLLPTAQQLVDAGTLPNTVLVANGGTLNPTDRVLNQYAAATTWGVSTLLADDLPPAAHTVKIEVTGYKPAASTDTRLYIAGFGYTTRSTTPATAGAAGFVRSTIVPRDSAWEYAHNIKPTGAATSVFIGNVHGYEDQSALAFTLDGAAVTLTDGQAVVGKKLVVNRTTALRHPDTGATKQADVTTTYTLTGNGLRVQHTTTWAVGGTVSASYPAMFPVNGALFTRGVIDTATTDTTLGAYNGAMKGSRQGELMAAWQPYTDLAAVLHLPDVDTAANGWANAAPVYMSFEDRAADGLGRTLNKFYVTRVSSSSPTTYAASDVWTSDALYRVVRVARGADAALSTTT